MASTEQDNPLDHVPEAAVESRRKGLSPVWLLPIVALLVGVWLVVKTVSERGPEIVVSFKTAEGIEQGKTAVKLKDVTVGSVQSYTFSKDLSEVLVTIEMISGTESYLTDKTRFWVVRPRVGAGQISGLGTLFSGAYIAIDPDNTGKPLKRFTGLEQPPIITAGREGTRYRLRADQAGSLSVGTPIYFRQIKVGEVTDFKLSDDDSHVDVGIFVEAPHDHQITTATRFWNASGVSVSLNASGMEVSLESLVSLLSGGITYRNPKQLETAAAAPQDYLFTLYPDEKASKEEPITNVTTFALRFDGTVRGLEVGAPVEYRGIRLGTVSAIQLGRSPDSEDRLVPVVLVDLEPQRLEMYSTVAGTESANKEFNELLHDPLKRARRQVEHGLRARLKTGNLVTGKLFVDLEFYPDAPPAELTYTGVYPEIPTMPGSLETILDGIQQLVNKLEKANIDQMVSNLNQLLSSTSTLMAVLAKDAPELSGELRGSLVELRSTFENAAETLKTVNRTASPSGEIGSQLQDTLREVSEAARSIRLLADYLERNPESLLKGKGAK
jgi:paraquat-inducible protein B